MPGGRGGGGTWVEERLCSLTNEQGTNAVGRSASHHNAIVEDSGKLGVGKGQSPQTQVGGCVGHSAQHKLDGVDHLVHHDLPKVKLLLMLVVVCRGHAQCCAITLLIIVIAW